MKGLVLFLLISGIMVSSVYAIPNLPAARCAGAAVVYDNMIYYFGGSNNWSGTVCYDSVFKYDGSHWDTVATTMPDYNTWGACAVLVSDTVYYVSGWPEDAGGIRRYAIAANHWDTTALASCGNSQSWGITSQYVNRFVFLFNGTGSVYKYSIDSNQWSNGSNRIGEPSGGYLSSIVYNNEIYVLGYGDNYFGKYTPSTQQWTTLATPLIDSVNVVLQAGCMAILGNRIYVAASVPDGSTSGFTVNNRIYSYEISNDSWHLDSAMILSGRAWCATAIYQGGVYIIGGLVDGNTAIDSVMQVVPLGYTAVNEKPVYSLPSDFSITAYPNPFNPSTHIVVNGSNKVDLTIYNALGQIVTQQKLFSASGGSIRWNWNAGGLPSGTYYLRIASNRGEQTKQLMLIK